ncbi:AsmA family protein [Caenimonas soli]|uniref:AsmA family protein n=1 Tax=Caenimonas soli TaxID=2735555 RepID=UPI0015523A3A|nr:AsmA family protein [Caenimonas soli]NPC55229.1 AsmA family protein [Caenimonas soli]
MTRLAKWLLALILLPLLLLGAVAMALQHWVGSEDFRGRVNQQASETLGVPVVVGGITVDVWPLPAVGLDKVQVKSQPPLTLERIEARPSWAPLLQGRLEIKTLLVRDAVVPERAVAAIAAAFQKTQRAKAGTTPPKESRGTMALLPRRTVLEQVTWVHAKGGSTTVDAQATLDDDGMPGTAHMEVRKGRLQGTKATMERQPDHWAVRIEIGGGTVVGKLRLQPGTKGASVLQGQFDTANVEVSALTAPSKTLTGRLEAQTNLRSEFREPGAIADALQSQTRFTVRNAVVHGIDLAQAVKTVGMNRSGETRLDTLAGNVVTQGRSVQLNNLVATSGSLSANGNVAMAPSRDLSGRVTVTLTSAAAGGKLGVPLVVGGTLDSPSVTLSQGALVGAAIGTVLAPGVGTGAGAGVGDKVGEKLRGLFGK